MQQHAAAAIGNQQVTPEGKSTHLLTLPTFDKPSVFGFLDL